MEKIWPKNKTNQMRIIKKYFNVLFAAMTHYRTLWFSLFIVSLMSVWDLTGAIIFDASLYIKVVYLIAISIFKATFLTLLYSKFHTNIIFRIFYITFISLFVVLSLINFVSFQLYGFGITRKLVQIFAQTTPNETYEFLPSLIHNITFVLASWRFYVLIIIVLTLGYIVRKCGKRTFYTIAAAGSAIGCVGFLFYAMTYTSGKSAHSIFGRAIIYSKEMADWNKTFIELSSHKKPLPDAETVSSEHLAKTVIVVIGESASRTHWSMYGYNLPTNPKLETMRDSLTLFSDVISSSKATSGNMERILSFKEDDTTYNDGLDHPLLVDFFKEAGYKTFWLSNQERVGSVSNTSGVMVMNADVIEYAGADNSNDALCYKYDEVLIPYLSEALKDNAENKIIFLHLIGSHVEFKNRYPATYNFFNSKNELDVFHNNWLTDIMAQRRSEYDNSIRYTDSILAEIIKLTSKICTPALFLYFSDHGENVYDESSFTGRDDSSVAIPFVIYANLPYRSQNASIMDRIGKSKSRPFSSANVIHLLLSLTGSKYSHYEPRLDIISDDYEIRPRFVDEEIWPREHIGK